MATIHRLQMPGRDTCAGTCETEAGCTCLQGCEGLCQQGRLSCNGKPIPMGRITAALIRERGHWPYMLGAIAAMLVIVCIAIGLALASVTA